MKELNQETAKKYALEKFSQLPELKFKWNKVHSEGIIEILKILTSDKNIDLSKLISLAWVHDIGKIKSDKNHAGLSLDILKKEFLLDKVDTDCILNHGSSANPKTPEGKLFRYADGLSLFTDKAIKFRFDAGSKEGLSHEEIKGIIKKLYEKYKVKYPDSKEIINLLDKLYKKAINLNP